MLLPIITAAVLTTSTNQASWELAELGHSLSQRPTVLIVGSPGVNITAYFNWAEAIESRGYNALFAKPSATISSVTQAQEGLRLLGEVVKNEFGDFIAVSHGYGGTLSILSEIPAVGIGLVGSPLGPHLAQTIPGPAPVYEGLPYPTDQTGVLPTAPITNSLSLELATWAHDTPALIDPAPPVVLLASDADVIAPPEAVRLPTTGWNDRYWLRDGFLSNYRSDHSDLLLNERVAINVIRALEKL